MIHLYDFFFIFFLLCGIACTLSPKMRGTLIILGMLIIYGFVTDFKNMSSHDLLLLASISMTIELTSSTLRFCLTKHYPLSRSFAVNAAVGKGAGVIVANAMFGSTIGIILWEFIANRTVMPYLQIIGKILLSLTLIALGRVVGGISMVAFVIYYILE